MNYLYVDGCSFTWGVGLDNPPEENWGYLLSKRLELQLKNNSGPGKGNDEIFRKIYELLYSNKNLPSIIVIQLSELTRIRIYDDVDMKWKSASPAAWDFPKKTQDYYWRYYYSIYQNVYYLFFQMLLFKDKCDSLGIEFYVFDGICDINLRCLKNIEENLEKEKLLDLYQSVKDKNFLLYNGDYSWNNINKKDKYHNANIILNYHDLFWKNRPDKPEDGEWSLDGDHPTKESHEFMANEIYNFIKELK
jgi:hypothetical protein